MRIATFNLENLGEPVTDPERLERRIDVLRPQLRRLDADILCLQEVNGQGSGHRAPRALAALDRLLEGTPYASFNRAATESARDRPLDVHNIVTLSRYPIVGRRQIRHELVSAPAYRFATAAPCGDAQEPVQWDRPLLLVELDVDGLRVHVLNVHLRAPLASLVPGQKLASFRWRTVGGWAEGFFIATVKRSGQALEARLTVERLFDADPDALVVVAGDFNADETEMPVRILLADPADTGNDALASRRLLSVDGRMPPEDRFSVRHAGRAVMLDHMLVSRHLFASLKEVAIDNQALPDEMLAAQDPAARRGSFHAPLSACFDLGAVRARPFTPD